MNLNKEENKNIPPPVPPKIPVIQTQPNLFDPNGTFMDEIKHAVPSTPLTSFKEYLDSPKTVVDEYPEEEEEEDDQKPVKFKKGKGSFFSNKRRTTMLLNIFKRNKKKEKKGSIAEEKEDQLKQSASDSSGLTYSERKDYEAQKKIDSMREIPQFDNLQVESLIDIRREVSPPTPPPKKKKENKKGVPLSMGLTESEEILLAPYSTKNL
eukprot:snap_masked-scaffold_71-processed-gene-0.17-mRNA-1 protein AED:0.07 eAED:0.07 QI:0/-1/0/1/-1/1/1/0/208